jgi:Na+/proline symporter/signal transduction histidine kinase/CheY-like chemotaxis protein
VSELAVLAASAAYLALLFAIASWGDRHKRPRRAPVAYTLGLAVYCTSWTFYGAVGEAASSGLDYLAIYVGPGLLLLFGWPILGRMIRIARAENVVSISDFISARYGKSRGLAALVTVTALLALLPYFALQLKGITISFEALSGGTLGGWTAPLVAAVMAGFAILFGVAKLDATEHRRGLVLSVATESVVKLVAALAVGLAITAFALDGPGALDALRTDPELARLAAFDPARADWWATCVLSALAFLCLPRQFHMAVVENIDPADLRTAAWAFPLYLAGISLFVLPVAAAGLLLLPEGVAPDTFMVAIPRELGWPWLALVAFIGGLSAATAMIVVSTLALGTMLSNDVIVPMLGASSRLRARALENPAPVLLALRRGAILLIMALAYGCYRLIGPGIPLTEIGLISFTAVAQFAPALLGGLVWRRATAAGAFAGIATGFVGWLWAVLLPAFAGGGWLPTLPMDIAIPARDSVLHGMAWSLGPNLLLFVAVSLIAAPSPRERRQAERFVDLRLDDHPAVATGDAAVLTELRHLAARFVGETRAASALPDDRPVRPEDALQETERLLAGVLGAASARVVVAGFAAGGVLSARRARALVDEASRAIMSRHETMRDTLENMPQGIAAFDADFRLELWNRRFVELLDQPPERFGVGTSLEEIVAYNEARGEYGTPREFDSLLSRRSDPTRRGRPDVFERRRLDGTVLEIATRPLPSGGFVAVYTDVTERHRAAAALRAANESLEARIAERTAALAEATAEAERANRAKTQFLTGVGHDLFQPLQAARLFLAGLAERSDDPAIPRIDASLGSLDHLLGELHEVARLDSGTIAPRLTDVAVVDVLGPLADQFAVLARRHGLGFRCIPSSARVRTDPALLRRIVQNFLANAVRHTPRGRVLLGCRRRSGALSIEVWDTGPGIPEDKRREIFAEFRQLGGTPSDRGQGLGLGLAIVERLAGLLDHPLEVRSRPGRGSAFAVRVPLAAPRAAAPAPAAPRGFDGRLVLVIENDPAIAEAMRALLAGWSLAVVVAATPEAALDALGGRVPDLVLSDFHLDAGLTGLAALDRLAAAFGHRPAAAIVTADRDPATTAVIEAAGLPVLRKPIRPGALRALLAQRLTRRDRAAE